MEVCTLHRQAIRTSRDATETLLANDVLRVRDSHLAAANRNAANEPARDNGEHAIRVHACACAR